jgi:hypothetical protein
VLTRPPWHDVVERHETAGAHERRIVGEVLLHPFVAVVAVDEQEVYRFAAEEPLDLLADARFVRVPRHQLHALSLARK